MIDIPQNNSTELEAKKKAQYEAELDLIAQQFLKELKQSSCATIYCENNMIGYQGSKEYHHLPDVLEVAKQFKAKGYYCYYCGGYNNGGVNQRAVTVCKVAKTEAERHQFRNWSWIAV